MKEMPGLQHTAAEKVAKVVVNSVQPITVEKTKNKKKNKFREKKIC